MNINSIAFYLDMKSRERFTFKWEYVIDLVRNAGLSCKALGLNVNSFYRGNVSPFWSGLNAERPAARRVMDGLCLPGSTPAPKTLVFKPPFWVSVIPLLGIRNVALSILMCPLFSATVKSAAMFSPVFFPEQLSFWLVFCAVCPTAGVLFFPISSGPVPARSGGAWLAPRLEPVFASAAPVEFINFFSDATLCTRFHRGIIS